MAKASKKGKQKADTPAPAPNQPAPTAVSNQPDVSQPAVVAPPSQPTEVLPSQPAFAHSNQLATVEEVPDDGFGGLDDLLEGEGEDDWAEDGQDGPWPDNNEAPVDSSWGDDLQPQAQAQQDWGVPPGPPQAPPPPPPVPHGGGGKGNKQHNARANAVAAAAAREDWRREGGGGGGAVARDDWGRGGGGGGGGGGGDWGANEIPLSTNPPSQGSSDAGWSNTGGGAWNSRAGDGWGGQPDSRWADPAAQQDYKQTQKQGGWMGWGDEARRLPKVTFDSAIPPSPSSTGTRVTLSQQQRSQLLSSLLNKPPQSQTYQTALASAAAAIPGQGNYYQPPVQQDWQQYQPQQQDYHQQQHHHQHQRHQSQYQEPPPPPPPPPPQQQQGGAKKGKKNKQQQQQQNQPKQKQHQSKSQRRQQQQEQEQQQDQWGDWGDGWADTAEDNGYYGEEDDGWGRRVHFSPQYQSQRPPDPDPASLQPSAVVENFTVNAFPPNQLGLSTYNMPSKTLAYAYQGTNTSIHSGPPARNVMQDYADVRFIESKGIALEAAQRALYSKSRLAKDRFHWMFPPDKDERVATLLAWIQSVSYGLGSYGLHKFLQSRERGALVVNADYRPAKSPNEPAFDWLTFDDLQPTMDRIMQESVAFYDPSVQVVVFVFLPSKTGNSLAIWRRKIMVPNNLRLAYQSQITQALAALRKDYIVHVDELPEKEEANSSAPSDFPKKKRKWWKFW